MQNVISINRDSLKNRPNDLMSIAELCAKYGYKYGYLYKWSVRAKNMGLDHIEPYYKGGLVLSEKDVLNFEERRKKSKYGRNQ